MPAKHPQLSSRQSRRLTLVAALLAATAFHPSSVLGDQKSTLKLLPPAVRSETVLAPKPAMALKRVTEDIEVQPVQDAGDNEDALPLEEQVAEETPAENPDFESPIKKRPGIKVPMQGATYRGVQSKLEMQPVAGPIFGGGLRGRQPLFKFRADTRKQETQSRSHRSLPRPPAARVAEQLPKQTNTGGWVSRGGTSSRARALPSKPSQSPLSDPSSARSFRGAAPDYATSPRPSVEPRVLAPRSPVASTLEFKVSPKAIDPPSIMAPKNAVDLPGLGKNAGASREGQNSVLRLRKQTEALIAGAEPKSTTADSNVSSETPPVVELVAPKASKAVPSVEIAKRKVATLSEMGERDDIRGQLEIEVNQQEKQRDERKASPRVASRSKSDEKSRTSQRSRIGDLGEDAGPSVTLDYIGMPAQQIKISPYVRQMKPGISRTLQYFYDRPEIAAGRSNWGMMHAIMVYGVDTRCAVGNTNYSTIAWIAGNNICRGQRLLTQENGRLKAKSGVGLQGHQAQMLAVFSLCDVPTNYPLYAGNSKYSMQHLIEEEKLACKSGEELTFSLIGLSHYLDTDAQWIAADGQRWSCARLIREELTQPINGVACGGTHRLMGYAHALRNRRAEGKPMTGQWARAEQYVRDFVNYTYSLQNRDGSMSTNWYEGRGDNRDVDRKIQTTGHMVEFLLTATPDSQLQDPRLVRAIAFLMNSLNRDLEHEWKIGPKGHALRSLAMYHDRIFKSGPAYRRQSIARGPSTQGSYR